ncbi:HlyD family secretion protein [Zooshikella harenae]|uniref:HlyD family efflux transporter periplasmic adaptor subunit n=1 Tax=Zooshikella harenae TaxID=2827238 RepID=A0ABS5Z8L7_9GAMM|nr:HlyD family efflux transporter periplasmic adaptor subunit [Zooshikella harenae]MBU2710118.1 HlyD family efflux transporter periplasmic adaptor subunit [Zooshikella harenae]
MRTMSAVWILLVLMVLSGCTDDRHRVFGVIERDRLTLTAPVNELIAQVLVHEGQQVKAGQVLIRLDATAAKARVQQADAELARVQAALEELKNGARVEDLAQAQAEVAGAEATLIEAESQLIRTQQLFQKKLVADRDLDVAKASRDNAKAVLDSANERLRELKNGTRSEQLAQGRAAVDSAKARLAEAQKVLADLTLVAAKKARVDVMPWRVGDRVAAGTQLIVLLAMDKPYVRAYLPETYLTKVKAGDHLPLYIDGQAQPIDGVVRTIRSQPAFTPYYALNERDRARLMYLTDIDLGAAGADLPTGLNLEVAVP